MQLSDYDWLQNRKYDTALYEFDITSGEDRYLFSLMWVDGKAEPAPIGLRGDVNNDKAVTIADVTALIDYLLSGNANGVNLENANCNHADDITIADVTALIDYLLSSQW